jgi:hypothetical protein
MGRPLKENMSHRGSKSERKAQNYRPSLFDQVGKDMRRNPPQWFVRGSGSIWYFIIAFALFVLWKMIRYR